MRLHRRGSWIDTRRELAQLAWAVLLIDAIAIGLGALATRPMGPFAFKVGIGLAVFVTVSFALVIGGNLLIEAAAHRWMSRHRAVSRQRTPKGELRADASLPVFLAARARQASDGTLATDAVGGLVATALVVVWRGPGWEVLLPMVVCVAAFGVWGIADRELAERPGATRGLSFSLRALRLLCAIAGFASGAVLLMVLLAVSLGRIIS